MASSYHLGSFDFNWRIPFSICCRAGLIVTNSVSFCSPEGLILLDLGFLVVSYFLSFGTLNIHANCVLNSKVSDEKSALHFIEDPLYVKSSFSLAAFKILSVFGF